MLIDFQPWVEVNDAEVYAVIRSIENDYIRLQNRTVKAMSYDIENITWHHIILLCFAWSCRVNCMMPYNFIQCFTKLEIMRPGTCKVIDVNNSSFIFKAFSWISWNLDFLFQAFDLFLNMFHCHIGVRHLKVITWNINHESYIYIHCTQHTYIRY